MMLDVTEAEARAIAAQVGAVGGVLAGYSLERAVDEVAASSRDTEILHVGVRSADSAALGGAETPDLRGRWL